MRVGCGVSLVGVAVSGQVLVVTEQTGLVCLCEDCLCVCEEMCVLLIRKGRCIVWMIVTWPLNQAQNRDRWERKCGGRVQNLCALLTSGPGAT